MRLFGIVILFIFFIIGCATKEEKSVQTPFFSGIKPTTDSLLNLRIIEYTACDTILRLDSNLSILINRRSFKNTDGTYPRTVKLSFIKINTPYEAINYGLTTNGDKQLLETYGMFYISAANEFGEILLIDSQNKPSIIAEFNNINANPYLYFGKEMNGQLTWMNKTRLNFIRDLKFTILDSSIYPHFVYDKYQGIDLKNWRSRNILLTKGLKPEFVDSLMINCQIEQKQWQNYSKNRSELLTFFNINQFGWHNFDCELKKLNKGLEVNTLVEIRDNYELKNFDYDVFYIFNNNKTIVKGYKINDSSYSISKFDSFYVINPRDKLRVIIVDHYTSKPGLAHSVIENRVKSKLTIQRYDLNEFRGLLIKAINK